jgi:hypothetical protein
VEKMVDIYIKDDDEDPKKDLQDIVDNIPNDFDTRQSNKDFEDFTDIDDEMIGDESQTTFDDSWNVASNEDMSRDDRESHQSDVYGVEEPEISTIGKKIGGFMENSRNRYWANQGIPENVISEYSMLEDIYKKSDNPYQRELAKRHMIRIKKGVGAVIIKNKKDAEKNNPKTGSGGFGKGMSVTTPSPLRIGNQGSAVNRNLTLGSNAYQHNLDAAVRVGNTRGTPYTRVNPDLKLMDARRYVEQKRALQAQNASRQDENADKRYNERMGRLTQTFVTNDRANNVRGDMRQFNGTPVVRKSSINERLGAMLSGNSRRGGITPVIGKNNINERLAQICSGTAKKRSMGNSPTRKIKNNSAINVKRFGVPDMVSSKAIGNRIMNNLLRKKKKK